MKNTVCALLDYTFVCSSCPSALPYLFVLSARVHEVCPGLVFHPSGQSRRASSSLGMVKQLHETYTSLQMHGTSWLRGSASELYLGCTRFESGPAHHYFDRHFSSFFPVPPCKCLDSNSGHTYLVSSPNEFIL